FITNMLPPGTEGVCAVRLQELVLKSTPIGREIFDSPGSFDNKALQQKLGFLADNIDLMVTAWSFRGNWSLSIVHSKEQIPVDFLRTVLRAKPVSEKEQIEGQEFFILEPN